MSEELIEANDAATRPRRSPALTLLPSGGTPPSGASYRPCSVLCTTPLRFGLGTMRPWKRTVRGRLSMVATRVRISSSRCVGLGTNRRAVGPSGG